jgi:hypothetical protein
MSFQEPEDPSSLEWKMGLNDKTTTNLANKETVIHMTIEPDHFKNTA